MRASVARRRGCRTTGSSMTARSPSATSGRSRSPRSRRGAASACGTSAPARVRSRSNGCSPIPPIARSPSSASRPRGRVARNAAGARRAASRVIDGAAPQRSPACRRRRDLRRRRRNRARAIDRLVGAARREGGSWSTRSRWKPRPAVARRAALGGELAADRHSRTPNRSARFPAGAPRCRVVQWRGEAMSARRRKDMSAQVGCVRAIGRRGRARSPSARSPIGAPERAACSPLPPRPREPGLVEAARLHRRSTLIPMTTRRQAAAARVLSPSPRHAPFRRASLAEAAALAGAGPGGPRSWPRHSARRRACAVALAAELS